MVIFFTQMVVCSTALAREKQVICIVKFIQISQKLKWESKTLFCSKKYNFFMEPNISMKSLKERKNEMSIPPKKNIVYTVPYILFQWTYVAFSKRMMFWKNFSNFTSEKPKSFSISCFPINFGKFFSKTFCRKLLSSGFDQIRAYQNVLEITEKDLKNRKKVKKLSKYFTRQ